jgi:2-oxoacid:acceptor oxidoreductase delta subunit (pyruvate/2-ketoisovalerate family)
MIKKCEKETIGPVKRKTFPFKKGKNDFFPAESGLSKEEAVREAQRCLGGRECESCEICGFLCPDLCISRDEKTGAVCIDLDYCKGCGICVAVCPKGAILMVLEEAV